MKTIFFRIYCKINCFIYEGNKSYYIAHSLPLFREVIHMRLHTSHNCFPVCIYNIFPLRILVCLLSVVWCTGQLQCWIELQPWQWRVYMTLITVALLIAPAIIISACYTVIVRTIWSKSKLLVPIAVPHHPQQHQLQHQASRRRQSRE